MLLHERLLLTLGREASGAVAHAAGYAAPSLQLVHVHLDIMKHFNLC